MPLHQQHDLTMSAYGDSTSRESLVGWKAIADYFGKTVRTIQRWERSERLPIRRHLHGVQSSVYAYKEEVDAWLFARSPQPNAPRSLRSDTDIADVKTLCALARYYWAQRTTDGFERSILLAREALRREPSSARALGVLARSLVTLASYGHVPPCGFVREAIEHARRSIALDSEAVEAHQALGLALLFIRDWRGARLALEAALAVDSDDATSYQWFSMWYVIQRSGQTACVMSTRAEALDPQAPILAAHTSWILLLTGDVAEAIAKAKSLVLRAPHFWRGYWNLALALIAADRPQEAADALTVSHAISPHQHNGFVQVHALARAGHQQQAESLFNRQLAAEGYVSPYWKAYAQMGFGAVDDAVVSLTQSMADQEWFVSFMRVDPVFRRLRGRQDFEALCRAADLP